MKFIKRMINGKSALVVIKPREEVENIASIKSKILEETKELTCNDLMNVLENSLIALKGGKTNEIHTI